MKTTKSILAILFVLLTAQFASAYYCPSTGRWLSRDPMGEPGFQALQVALQMPTGTSGRWINRDRAEEKAGLNIYGFVMNSSVNFYDLLGGIGVAFNRCADALTRSDEDDLLNSLSSAANTLAAELKPNNSLIRSYVWGTDLSGTSQGAGGVGGLLEISYYGSSTTNCFPAYDGNK